MWRRVEELRAFKHSCGIGEPDGIPVRLDFACSGPAGAGSTIKVLEGGRVQKERFERHRNTPILPFEYGLRR
ncbi:hypothetical protein GRAN_2426 [Granulicella sibirica]|uniref:Uncharacterized protein n=1 Tax=Granulicella sibirica TaxID=2479048 RepID=A0A4Q0T132_9BACT|nr:hypothetical protein GRAN_2426 [Granulicella sibirica]